MNRETQSIEKNDISLYGTVKRLLKRHSTYTSIHIFSKYNTYHRCFGILGITAMITQHAPPDWFYNLSLSISFVLAQGLVLMLFCLT